MKKFRLIIITIIFTVLFSMLTYADWQKVNDRYKYFNSSNNAYIINNWMQTGNGFYYFDNNGYAVIGWYLINGQYYYFNQDGIMQIGFQTINDKTYYLDINSGRMITGWVQKVENGLTDYYYFDQNGVMCTGWNEIDGKWYYFHDGKVLADTWAKVNNVWYHFANSGAMDTGWIKSNDKMYYLNISNGALQTGWIQDQQGNEYYLSEYDGSLTVNTTLNIGGRSYVFDDMGKCVGKDVYSFQGDQNGNITGLSIMGAINGTTQVYGINIGVSPGANNVGGTVGVTQKIEANASLEAGATTGPK